MFGHLYLYAYFLSNSKTRDFLFSCSVLKESNCEQTRALCVNLVRARLEQLYPSVHLQFGGLRPAFLSHSTCVPYNTGLLSNQGEKSINFYFIVVPLRKKVLKYGTPKPSVCPTTTRGVEFTSPQSYFLFGLYIRSTRKFKLIPNRYLVTPSNLV